MSDPLTGPSRRVQKVEKEVKEAIASFFISGLREKPSGFLSVTRVMMAGDLRTAKVYVSLFRPEKNSDSRPEKNAAQDEDEVLELLQKQAYEIQGMIGKNLALKFCPKLTFFMDESFDAVLRVDRTLYELEQEKQKLLAAQKAQKNKQTNKSEDESDDE